MARYKPYDFNQSVMIPLCLEEQLVPGTFEYAVHHLIEERFEPALFEDLYDNDAMGARAYAPQMLLKLILFGYSRGVNSSRKLERACREQVLFMALAAGEKPDHSTFAGFISKVGGLLPEIFANVLLVCEEEDLLSSTHFSLDGLKLPANASKSGSGKFADLEAKRDKLCEKARVLLEEHKASDGEGDGGDDPDRPRKAADRLRKQADKIDRFLNENSPRKGAGGKEIQSNITDNDSTKMKTSHGVIQGYNAQAMADSAHQVIVWAGASGEGQDGSQVPAALEGATDNLTYATGYENPLAGATFTADSNYHSQTNLEACEQRAVDAYIPDNNFRKRDKRFDTRERHKAKERELRSHFTNEDFNHDPDTDTYTCPAGKPLRLTARASQSRGGIYRRYRAVEDCTGCEFYQRCFVRSGGKRPPKRRTLSFPVEGAAQSLCAAMREKIDQPASRTIYSMRQGNIEPVYGNIRYCKGLDRFHYRGLKKVNAQWQLYCLVHNIEKLAHYAPSYQETQKAA